jgi:hypothetical protein
VLYDVLLCVPPILYVIGDSVPSVKISPKKPVDGTASHVNVVAVGVAEAGKYGRT